MTQVLWHFRWLQRQSCKEKAGNQRIPKVCRVFSPTPVAADFVLNWNKIRYQKAGRQFFAHNGDGCDRLK